MEKGIFKNIDDITALKMKHRRTCPVCGGELQYNPRRNKPGQWAHFLCATKTHYQVYGKEVIESYWNGIMVCSLKCNNAVQLNKMSQPVLCDELAEWVQDMERVSND